MRKRQKSHSRPREQLLLLCGRHKAPGPSDPRDFQAGLTVARVLSRLHLLGALLIWRTSIFPFTTPVAVSPSIPASHATNPPLATIATNHAKVQTPAFTRSRLLRSQQSGNHGLKFHVGSGDALISCRAARLVGDADAETLYAADTDLNRANSTGASSNSGSE